MRQERRHEAVEAGLARGRVRVQRQAGSSDLAGETGGGCCCCCWGGGGGGGGLAGWLGFGAPGGEVIVDGFAGELLD